jgi:hypothetical protein
MSIRRSPAVDIETLVASAILWGMSLGLGRLLGLPLLASAGLSFLAVFALTAAHWFSDKELRRLLGSPGSALFFFVVGLVLATISLAADCLIGSSLHPRVSLVSACTENAGVGFAFTIVLAVVAVGAPLLGLLRVAVAVVLRRGG